MSDQEILWSAKDDFSFPHRVNDRSKSQWRIITLEPVESFPGDINNAWLEFTAQNIETQEVQVLRAPTEYWDFNIGELLDLREFGL